MKLTAVVHPRSKEEKVVRLDERYVEVYFNVVPQKGKANEKLIEMLAKEFGVAKSCVEIKSGHRSQLKIVEINSFQQY